MVSSASAAAVVSAAEAHLYTGHVVRVQLASGILVVGTLVNWDDTYLTLNVSGHLRLLASAHVDYVVLGA